MTAPTGDWQAYLDSLAVFGMRPGLERVTGLLAGLGHPEGRLRFVHVVGTNGKSSTTRYCAAVLRAHGLRAGAYLSPHIMGWNERVLVDGTPVATAALGAAVERVRDGTARLPEELGETTQFEVLTTAALLVLAESGVEAVALEAGLGGRLDATNVVAAEVVVLTNVGLEHTEVLGDTREAIFAEKAAVIKGGDAVFGPLEGLEGAAEQVCARVGARVHLLGRDFSVEGDPHDFAVATARARYTGLRLPTLARYQVVNAGLAVVAAELLLGGLDTGATRAGLATALVPGRLEVVGDRPLTLADGAHNAPGMRALAETLRGLTLGRPRVGVLAVLRGKDVDGMLDALLPHLDAVVCTESSEPRCRRAGELARHVRRAAARADGVTAAGRDDAGLAGGIVAGGGGAGGPLVHVVADPEAALARARTLAGEHGTVLVTGSLYLLENLSSAFTPSVGESPATGSPVAE